MVAFRAPSLVSSFNEAARFRARRPRTRLRISTSPTRFNEAARFRARRLAFIRDSTTRVKRFNEAARFRARRLARVAAPELLRHASMRPLAFARGDPMPARCQDEIANLLQ